MEKSALLALLLSVLLIAILGGSKRGIAAAGIAAVMLAWFLPPNGSLTVTGLDNRLALALFILGTVVGGIVVEGKSMAQALDYDVGSGSLGGAKIGAGGGNRTHGLGIMRPSLYH